jgi:signal transduction histidine kinase
VGGPGGALPIGEARQACPGTPSRSALARPKLPEDTHFSVKEELEERLAFLGLAEADRRLLADLRPVLATHADRLVGAFYRHLLSYEETRRLLADPRVKERLLGKQRAYLLSLAGPSVDDAYCEERVRIGEVHAQIGLAPRWYLGAYALYFSLLAPLVAEAHHGDPDRSQRTLAALVKLLMLDTQLAMESYIARHEEALEHLNRELAAASRSLTLEYEAQGNELRQTEQRARAAEDLASIATLVAGLAHEIGTPMGVIRGHAEALSGAVQGERAQWRVRTILDQIDRISSIIRSLLNIAHPREAVRVALEVSEVADTALAFLSEKLRRRAIDVERRYEPVPTLKGDPDKIQQLLLNLFLNAADAMPEGGQLRVEIKPGGPDSMEIRVSDTGIGISPQDLEHLFKPFFTTKPAGRGSGLGLVVAQGIVADYGGRIEVASELGRGTEFRIRLPLDPQAPAGGASPS